MATACSSGDCLFPCWPYLKLAMDISWRGLLKVYNHNPEKFNVIGAADSVLPFETLFTGLVINQLYFWSMNQTILQRALGAKNLVEAQKGLLYAGVLKLLVPIIIVLPGVIGFYYFGDSLYAEQDMVYPALIKRVLPVSLVGFFAAVVMGAVLSTFNSALNSAATIFSVDVYKRHVDKASSDKKLVWVGRLVSRCSRLLRLPQLLWSPMPRKACISYSNNSMVYSLSDWLDYAGGFLLTPRLSRRSKGGPVCRTGLLHKHDLHPPS